MVAEPRGGDAGHARYGSEAAWRFLSLTTSHEGLLPATFPQAFSVASTQPHSRL